MWRGAAIAGASFEFTAGRGQTGRTGPRAGQLGSKSEEIKGASGGKIETNLEYRHWADNRIPPGRCKVWPCRQSGREGRALAGIFAILQKRRRITRDLLFLGRRDYPMRHVPRPCQPA